MSVDRIVLIVVVLALSTVGILMMRDYDRQIDLLQAVLNETRIELDIVTDNLTKVLQQLELERVLVTNGQALRNFKSLDELEEFLANDDTDQNQYVKTTFDCDDFAMMLQRHAAEKGFIINCQKMPVGGLEHMNNLAICGNDLYSIEAKTDKITYVGFLD